jgi:hypothetical protein
MRSMSAMTKQKIGLLEADGMAGVCPIGSQGATPGGGRSLKSQEKAVLREPSNRFSAQEIP